MHMCIVFVMHVSLYAWKGMHVCANACTYVTCPHEGTDVGANGNAAQLHHDGGARPAYHTMINCEYFASLKNAARCKRRSSTMVNTALGWDSRARTRAKTALAGKGDC